MSPSTDGFSASYDAEPESISRARGEIAGYARSVGIGPSRIADVRLAVSEAVTNSVLHGYGGATGDVCVTARREGDSLHVRVRDSGRGMKPRSGSPAPSLGLGAGLGVIGQIVDEMSVATRDEGGTDVRMRFDIAEALIGGVQTHLLAAAQI